MIGDDHSLSRRAALAWLGTSACGAGALSGLGSPALAQNEPRVLSLVARRFAFEPQELQLKVGEPVIIAIRSLDFVHGMNIPDLGLRRDLLPGRETRIELTPAAPGVIRFLCDNFCGDGHETMQGRFVVSS